MASERSGRRAANHGQENFVVNKRPPSGGNRFLRHSNSSSLEILESEDSLKIGSNHGKDFHKENRPGSSGKKKSGSVPPRPDSTLTRRTPTPTKQISLQAVRRKEENDNPIVADVDWKELQSHSRNKGRKDVPTTQFKEMSISDKTGKSDKSSIPFSYSSNHHNCSHHVERPERREDERVKLASKPTKESQKKDTRGKPSEQVTAETVDKSEEEEEEEDSSSSEEEEEERKAPNQLLMEFVTSLMDKDYVGAEKLCKMILLYEPHNQEALKFQPLIEEKIALDKEPEYESEESDGEEGYEKDDDDDDDEDDDGTEDDDSDSSGSDSDSDSDSDEDDSEQEEQRVDSGIASAAGSEFNV